MGSLNKPGSTIWILKGSTLMVQNLKNKQKEENQGHVHDQGKQEDQAEFDFELR